MKIVIMSKVYIYITFLFILIASCNKDKFNTKPTLTYKDVNTKQLARNQDLKIELTVTDAEGDLTDSITVLKKTRNCTNSNDTAKFKIPIFPTNKNVNVALLIGYTHGIGGTYPSIKAPQCANRNDSCVFRFVIKDKAGNLSDTISTPEIVILR